MGKEGANGDRAIAAIAARQHGVVSTQQLGSVGITDIAMSRRVRGGRLHRLHRGVYAVGQARLSFDGRCMAAVLACGDGTVVSHGSAAGLWLLLSPASGPIHVTVPGDGGRKRRRGIINHRSPTFVARFATRRDGVPVTKPSRTLRDLHRTVPEPVYRRAVRRGLDLRLISKRGAQER